MSVRTEVQMCAFPFFFFLFFFFFFFRYMQPSILQQLTTIQKYQIYPITQSHLTQYPQTNLSQSTHPKCSIISSTNGIVQTICMRQPMCTLSPQQKESKYLAAFLDSTQIT
eukprot:TRINITY_DN780_c2_g2_i1.p3 TRINITY_DN780_c2_g2~~TRINITY_DN780_c2_g2_i1.p3  ORF type:complete len:111 (+),score=2.79 TRINITY_DN780_c2_g2_i1:1-333(+)